tara:strand:- start:14839 stop:16641 length:1803 start_codon:yes stop_codon:yes gene_type:complete
VPKRRENIDINYLSRDFQSIKDDLTEYARRYYPDTFRDFSDAGFGALMLDMVSYVGDVMSFYLDYQANESFLSTAVEYENVLKHGQSMGYKHQGANSTYGTVTLYITVPSADNGVGPNDAAIPILKAGTQFMSENNSIFTLMEDVNFADSVNDMVVANTSTSTGMPSQYAIRATGQVVSGENRFKRFTVGSFQKFRVLNLGGNNVTEILSVYDSNGNSYYEVEHLSQDTIYLPITNTDTTTNVQTPTIIKPVVVPRRFIVGKNRFSTNLIFGYGSDTELNASSLVDPASIVMDLHAKNYVTDRALDPSNLVKTDKFGVGPSNTDILVTYRTNTNENSNASSNTITRVVSADMQFKDPVMLNTGIMNSVQYSLEVNNEEPIQGDVSPPNLIELRELIQGSFSAHNRAVTAEDYKALIYTIPSRFGTVYRCSVVQDVDSNLRNINIYTICRSNNGYLEVTNNVLKENIKTWLNTKRMINDSIDILDAKIVNLGIEFELLSELSVNKTVVLNNAISALSRYLLDPGEVGEHFGITDIYSILNDVPGVADATYVSVYQKRGTGYSSVSMDVKSQMTADGRFIKAPKNVIFEVKYPSSDIQGTIK